MQYPDTSLTYLTSKLKSSPNVALNPPFTSHPLALLPITCSSIPPPHHRLARPAGMALLSPRHFSTHPRLRPYSLPTSLIFQLLTLLLCTHLTVTVTFAYPLHPPPPVLSVLTLPPSTPSLHALDNVGPALANATQSALTAGEQLLTQYADLLRLLAIPVGLAIAFFGYFLLGPVLFFSGFAVGGGACFVAVHAVLDTVTTPTAWLAIIASLLGGALLAFLALHALPVGLFVAGASLGLVIASTLRPSVIPHFFPNNAKLAFVIIAILLGILFGLLALIVQKQMLIFSTAYGGAGAAAYGAGRFLRHFPNEGMVDNLVAKGDVNGWLLLYALLAMAVGTIGAFFQSWLARDRPMHERAPRERRRRRRRRRRDDDWYEDDDDDPWMADDRRERVALPRKPRSRGVMEERSDPSSVVYLSNGRAVGATDSTDRENQPHPGNADLSSMQKPLREIAHNVPPPNPPLLNDVGAQPMRDNVHAGKMEGSTTSSRKQNIGLENIAVVA